MTHAIEQQRTRQVPRYRLYPVEVAARASVGPSFVRVTLAGDSLRSFGATGADQRVKLVLPRPGRELPEVPEGVDWYTAWRELAEDVRPVLRTYTVRAFRPERGELDIDFVLHDSGPRHGGPASAWAASAGVGERVGILGPDRPGSGRMWGREWDPPECACRFMLAGDETAVPAIGAIVEGLPADARGIVCLEVPTERDRQSWHAPAGIQLRWLARRRAAGPVPRGSLLAPEVARALGEIRGAAGCPGACEPAPTRGEAAVLWDVPEHGDTEVPGEEFYGWFAGEAGLVKRLRRLVLAEHGVPRKSVAFMGYWKDEHPSGQPA
ncbi:siderophore-interacting protein [Haloechinothrix sp. YIM 98757]|uniref:Siderophore-interacting protein n=1 Tax=Haloechinothrix aidingensis TaxID=2752311 RepID=A0A838A7C2_9PSEU|nr:siderophore-interacting protein [Haloechinothrix aidingensis]